MLNKLLDKLEKMIASYLCRDENLIGSFEVDAFYFDYPHDPMCEELCRLSGLPVSWKLCKNLESLGMVKLSNKCELSWYPYDYPWVNEGKRIFSETAEIDLDFVQRVVSFDNRYGQRVMIGEID